jgi:hypothetical protein
MLNREKKIIQLIRRKANRVNSPGKISKGSNLEGKAQEEEELE